MVTTIQISKELKDKLAARKLEAKDTYEDVIWDLLEDTMELSEATKKAIDAGRAQIARGEYYTLEEVKKRLGM